MIGKPISNEPRKLPNFHVNPDIKFFESKLSKWYFDYVLVIFTTFNSVNWGMPVSGMSKENKKFQVKYQKCTYSKGHYVHVSGNI